MTSKYRIQEWTASFPSSWIDFYAAKLIDRIILYIYSSCLMLMQSMLTKNSFGLVDGILYMDWLMEYFIWILLIIFATLGVPVNHHRRICNQLHNNGINEI